MLFYSKWKIDFEKKNYLFIMLGDYLFIIINLFSKNNLKNHCITSFLLYYFTVIKNIKKGNGSSKRDIIRCIICPKNNITMKKKTM